MSKRKQLLSFFDFADFLVIAGLGMYFYGVYQYSPWVAYSTTGLFVLAIGLRGQPDKE